MTVGEGKNFQERSSKATQAALAALVALALPELLLWQQ
jgi:hypothetical protein